MRGEDERARNDPRRNAWGTGGRGLRRGLALALLLSCACSRTTSEPEAKPRATASGDAAGAEGEPWVPLDGGWFSVSLPPRWQSLPLTTPKRRAMFARQLNTPKDQPDVLVIVSRPRPLDDGAAHDAALPTRVASRMVLRSPDGPPAPATLAGAAAAVVSESMALPNAGATRTWHWAAVKDGHLLVLTCMGKQDAGVALAEKLCPRIASGFRVPTALVVPSRPAPPSDKPLTPRAFGPVQVDVPPDWETSTPDWLAPPAVGAVHSPIAESGPFEVALLQVAVVPGAPSTTAMANELVKAPTMRRLNQGNVTLPIGEALETDVTDDAGTRTIAYHVLPPGGRGYEMICSAPERAIDAFRPMCRAAAKSMRLR